MTKKDILWFALLLIGSVIIGRLWVRWHDAINTPAPSTGITPADIAAFDETPSAAPSLPPDFPRTARVPDQETPLPTFPAGTAPVRVLAAASTGAAIRQRAVTFTKKTGVEVIVSTGGSNQLAQQLLAGAPADLFLSASSEWADAVAAKLPVARRRILWTNDLVLIVPHDNPAGIQSPQDLHKPEMKHLALAGQQVPAGKYADQALTKLNLLQPLEDSRRIVRGSDVQAACAFVLRGEAEAGIVYKSDALLETATREYDRKEPSTREVGETGIHLARIHIVYTFPAESHPPIVYPLVQFQRDNPSPAAAAFYDFLANSADCETAAAFGFGAAP